MYRLSKNLQNWSLSPWLTVLILVAVLALAAYLRLVHIGHNPGWYTAEATHLLIGQQLLKGRSQYLAINQSTLLFAHLPANIPPDRYVFDPCYQNASFIIIDNLWHNWGLPNVPTLTAITREIETTWPLVYQSGDIVVYANPQILYAGLKPDYDRWMKQCNYTDVIPVKTGIHPRLWTGFHWRGCIVTKHSLKSEENR